jgi:pyrrolidone-carboxylate peptidase
MREQHLDRQLNALRALGLKDRQISHDKANSKDFERPAWKHLVARLHEEDTPSSVSASAGRRTM